MIYVPENHAAVRLKNARAVVMVEKGKMHKWVEGPHGSVWGDGENDNSLGLTPFYSSGFSICAEIRGKVHNREFYFHDTGSDTALSMHALAIVAAYDGTKNEHELTKLLDWYVEQWHALRDEHKLSQNEELLPHIEGKWRAAMCAAKMACCRACAWPPHPENYTDVRATILDKNSYWTTKLDALGIKWTRMENVPAPDNVNTDCRQFCSGRSDPSCKFCSGRSDLSCKNEMLFGVMVHRYKRFGYLAFFDKEDICRCLVTPDDCKGFDGGLPSICTSVSFRITQYPGGNIPRAEQVEPCDHTPTLLTNESGGKGKLHTCPYCHVVLELVVSPDDVFITCDECGNMVAKGELVYSCCGECKRDTCQQCLNKDSSEASGRLGSQRLGRTSPGERKTRGCVVKKECRGKGRHRYFLKPFHHIAALFARYFNRQSESEREKE